MGIGLGSIILFVVWAIGSGAVAAFAIVFRSKKGKGGFPEQEPALPRVSTVEKVPPDEQTGAWRLPDGQRLF